MLLFVYEYLLGFSQQRNACCVGICFVESADSKCEVSFVWPRRRRRAAISFEDEKGISGARLCFF